MPENTDPSELFPAKEYDRIMRLAKQDRPSLMPGAEIDLEKYLNFYETQVPETGITSRAVVINGFTLTVGIGNLAHAAVDRNLVSGAMGGLLTYWGIKEFLSFRKIEREAKELPVQRAEFIREQLGKLASRQEGQA
jgi:hypothetical protein